MSIFWDGIEGHLDAPALISEGRIVSYEELASTADEIASALGGRSLVLFICRISTASVAGYMAMFRARAVPLLLAEGLPAESLASIAEAYRPTHIYAPIELTDAGTTLWSGGGYRLVRTDADSDLEMSPDLAVLLTTSGSTGSPKFVRQTYANIEANTASIIEYLGIAPGDRAITTLPMNYTYGLSIIQTHLTAGAAIVLNDAAMTEKRFWTALRESEATTFGGVPYSYELLDRLRFDRMDLPSIRYLTQAGGKLAPHLAQKFIDTAERMGHKFIIMYGQSEATARISWLPWEHAREKAASIGIAIPGGTLSIEDDDGREITSADAPGELIYRGPNVTPGYAQSRHDLAAPDENRGKLRTGDMATRDSDGFFYIVGRKKRFLKIYGSRVNLDEVEGIVRRASIDCAASGRDDMLELWVTSDADAARAAEMLRGETSINRAGWRVRVTDAIPRSESGKIQYGELEARA